MPDSASLIAAGNRQNDRGVFHRMSTAFASRFIHIDVRVDVMEWTAWAVANNLAPEVIFFVQMRPELLHQFDPLSSELAFPCPRTWEFVSNVMEKANGNLAPDQQRAIYRGAVGEGAAVEFTAFLKVWGKVPHPQTIINDPENAPVPDDTSALLALCGSLYRLAEDTNFDSIITYATRLRPEVGEFLVGSCIRNKPELQYTRAWVQWMAQSSAQ